tara:strand:+ start:180 stop:353 length:174 start_codon:yes stop_codon:yes gene_type:complete
MKKIYIILILSFSACTSPASKNVFKNDLIFTNEMKFQEFKLKVKEYATKSSYPNIDN